MNSPSPAAPIAIQVELAERTYPIYIGQQLTAAVPGWMQAGLPQCQHAVLIFDEHLEELASSLQRALSAARFRCSLLSVPSGEASKSVEMAAGLWQSLVHENTDRGSCVVAVGGGVVGDLAGFVAATFARGLPLIQVPTTLLSQVDSSVGGKTGINLPNVKNIVGAFWQPTLVAIDTHTLESLPRREFVSGLAEVVKYGVILLPQLFEYLEQHAAEILSKESSAIGHVVAESCKAKAGVVQQDERETTGLRAILNYGHTFAHALESVAGYGTLLHGEAVAIGMHMAALLAQQLGRVDQHFVQRQRALLERLELPTRFEADASELWKIMQHDKKVEHGTLRFILPTRLGQVERVAGVTERQVVEAIMAANAAALGS